jgi:Uma2 family endonuclease
MLATELITVEQYLHMTFEHDAEFVEGRIVERPVPILPHSRLQAFLSRFMYDICLALGFFVLTEQRVQVLRDRFRIPDVCVVDATLNELIVVTPPHLCIEILSPDERMGDTLEKIREYREFGVPWIWVIDPVTLTGQIYGPAGIVAVENATFYTDRFEIDLTAFSHPGTSAG